MKPKILRCASFMVLLFYFYGCLSTKEYAKYDVDTLQLSFGTLVAKRIYPQQLTNEAYQYSKEKQVFCCLEINQSMMCMVANPKELYISRDVETIKYLDKYVLLQRLNELIPEANYRGDYTSDTEYKCYNKYDTLVYWLQWDPNSPDFVNIEISSEWTLGWCKIRSEYFPFGSLRCGMRYQDVLCMLNINDYISRNYKQIIILEPQAVRDMWFYHYGERMNMFDDSVACIKLTFKNNYLIAIEEGNLLFPDSSLLKDMMRK